MDAPTRWNVTFTKHLKQKRKVYRDGFLSLHSSTGKVMLYDDSEELLECRILSNDEVVSSGEMLTFNAYLVDVGELEEGQKPLDGTPIRSPENKVPKGRASLHRNKFVKVSDCADEKTKAEKDKQQTISLSPSQKIIREFKKNEMNKYGILQTSPNSRTASTADWHALYTTHLTQKSKKYHDGFLRCTSSGSMTRQVFLYDTSWKLLDSRFLNRAEEVSPGEMMEFPGHLVEVGNSKANHESLRDLNACGNSFNSLHKLHMQKQKHNVTTHKSAVKEEKNGQMHHNGANGSILEAGKSSVTEWQVLYTTQVTQKAKKYHDGFLQLEVRGSLGRQVTLYDASRKVLANKFLRKDEVLGAGKSLVFDSHLVDIGEHAEEKASMGLNDHEPCRAAGEMRKGHGEVNGVKVDQSIMRVLWQKYGDKTPGKVHPARDLDSNSGISDMKSTDCIRRVPENKPLRNAYQILSVLRRPLDQVATAENSYERKATFASLTEELQHSDNSSDGAQRQRAPAAKLASVENVDTGNITDSTGNEKLLGLMKTKDVATDFHDYHSMAGFGIGNSQPSHKPADPKFCGNNLASEASLSRGSRGDADDEKTTPEGDRDPLKVKAECPSFDLGF